MFDSVLHRGNEPKTRFGWGTFASLVIHVGLIGLTIYLTTRPPPVKEDLTEVKFFAMAPPPPPPPPPPPKKTTKVEKKVQARPDQIVQPKEIPSDKPKEEEKSAPEEKDEGVEGGVEGGIAGGVLGGVLGGVVGGSLGGTDVIPFGEGMTRPEYDRAEISRNIYSQEAREAQVEGMLIVKCNVLSDGTVHNCRVLKPLPFLAEAVVQRLQSMHIRPASFQGKPVSVDYVFNFQFKMPR